MADYPLGYKARKRAADEAARKEIALDGQVERVYEAVKGHIWFWGVSPESMHRVQQQMKDDIRKALE